MARSISYANNYAAIAYKDISSFGYGEDEDGEEFFDDFFADDDWCRFIEDIKETASSKWSSFVKCDTWLANEVHAILENDLAYITVSTYGGLASICLVSRFEYKDPYYSDDIKKSNLSHGYCKKIARKFESLFGEYSCIGRFSNGEAIYQKIA